MSARSLARRYAAALFDVARRNGSEDQAGQDLSGIASLINDNEQLRKLFETPAIPPAKKKAVLDAVLTAAGGTSVEVRRMLLMLVERGRLMIVPDIAESFAARLMQEKRVMPAEVVTAAPLSDRARAGLAEALGKATGVEVTMIEHVDPAIIGGVVAKVGSVVFDGSVARHLERLGQRLRAES